MRICLRATTTSLNAGFLCSLAAFERSLRNDIEGFIEIEIEMMIIIIIIVIVIVIIIVYLTVGRYFSPLTSSLQFKKQVNSGGTNVKHRTYAYMSYL